MWRRSSATASSKAALSARILAICASVSPVSGRHFGVAGGRAGVAPGRDGCAVVVVPLVAPRSPDAELSVTGSGDVGALSLHAASTPITVIMTPKRISMLCRMVLVSVEIQGLFAKAF